MLGLVIIIILAIYMAYRLWPNSLARKIKYETYEGVSDEILLRHIKANRIEKIKEEKIELKWLGWRNCEESNLETVMRVLGGYGEIFKHMAKLKRMYFREIVRHVGRAEIARSWIKSATELGLLRRGKDADGVIVYIFDEDGLRRLIEYLDAALGGLIGE